MKRKLICRGILIVLILITALFLYSENVNKIEIVDNVKNILSEQIQKTISALTGNEEPTVIDVTGLIKGKETEHEHFYKTMYDDDKHWEECTVCGEKKDESEHSFTTTWALGKESCAYGNSYTNTCDCGYSEIGHKPCVWNGKYGCSGYFYHWKVCSVCNDGITHSYYKNAYGNGKLYNLYEDVEDIHKMDDIR